MSDGLPTRIRPGALLVDLDDTLYDYAPADARARRAVFAEVARLTGIDADAAQAFFRSSRAHVKARLGHTGAAHSRLLYLLDLAHDGRVPLSRVADLEALFWREYMRDLHLKPFARELLDGFRREGGKVAIVTDLTVDVQLRKLEALDLFRSIDAIAVSEEVGADKPDARIFELAAKRLGVPLATCVVVGDHPDKDGEGARRLGLPFHLVRSSERPDEGCSLEDIADALGLDLTRTAAATHAAS
jgi:putative hydrolase of the HAD superfamily